MDLEVIQLYEYVDLVVIICSEHSTDSTFKDCLFQVLAMALSCNGPLASLLLHFAMVDSANNSDPLRDV